MCCQTNTIAGTGLDFEVKKNFEFCVVTRETVTTNACFSSTVL